MKVNEFCVDKLLHPLVLVFYPAHIGNH